LSLEPEAELALAERDWPGNVRELRHTLERACIFADGDRLRTVDLFDGPLERPAPPAPTPPGESAGDPSRSPGRSPDRSLEHYLADCERQYIERTLEVNAGRVAQTAERLGISRKSLWERMKRLGIRRRDPDPD
jgi:DNA-binding NtrC family response regulator